MAKHCGDMVGQELCLMLGENPDNLYSISIVAKANSVVAVTIERYLDSQEIDKIKTVLSKYALVPLESICLK